MLETMIFITLVLTSGLLILRILESIRLMRSDSQDDILDEPEAETIGADRYADLALPYPAYADEKYFDYCELMRNPIDLASLKEMIQDRSKGDMDPLTRNVIESVEVDDAYNSLMAYVRSSLLKSCGHPIDPIEYLFMGRLDVVLEALYAYDVDLDLTVAIFSYLAKLIADEDETYLVYPVDTYLDDKGMI